MQWPHQNARDQPAQGQAQQQGGQRDQGPLPAQAVGIDQQFVLGHQQCQLQSAGPAFGDMAAGDYPVASQGLQVTVNGLPLQQGIEHRVQVIALDQARAALFQQQLVAVGVGHDIALVIQQRHLGGRCDPVLGQGR